MSINWTDVGRGDYALSRDGRKIAYLRESPESGQVMGVEYELRNLDDTVVAKISTSNPHAAMREALGVLGLLTP